MEYDFPMLAALLIRHVHQTSNVNLKHLRNYTLNNRATPKLINGSTDITNECELHSDFYGKNIVNLIIILI